MPNPDFTKDAQEQAKEFIAAWTRHIAGEEIAQATRQAEQAAREQALEECEKLAQAKFEQGRNAAPAIRALKDQK